MAPRARALPAIADRLEACELPDGGSLPRLSLAEMQVEHQGRGALAVERADMEGSAVHGLALQEGVVGSLRLRDSRLVECDLSNVRARGAELRRVELIDSRTVGLALNEAQLSDVLISGGTLMLGSLGHSRLSCVSFERVNLRETSFVEATLEGVSFDGCELTGADFRGARLTACTIRGSSLEGVAGVDCLAGLTMPWGDLVDSVGALSAALGIAVESD